MAERRALITRCALSSLEMTIKAPGNFADIYHHGQGIARLYALFKGQTVVRKVNQREAAAALRN